MSRLFTFGCSFTSYAWPTWANIIAFDQDLEIHNFAQAGMGNFGIANRVIEADLKYKFKDDDIICIMWTSWDREDRIKNTSWNCNGSIFFNNEYYDKLYIKKFYDEGHKVVSNTFYIHAINKLYGDKISWQGSGFAYYLNDTYENPKQYIENKSTKKVIKMYKSLLPDIYKWTNAESFKSFGVLNDKHPDINAHLDLVVTQIYPKLGFTLKTTTQNRLNKFHNSIVEYFSSKLPVKKYFWQKTLSNNDKDIPELMTKFLNNEFKDIKKHMKLEKKEIL
tara:strand:+ start:2262 stop:3095 length:834 start_codon:yes stop_codon:yes gene_type:complete